MADSLTRLLETPLLEPVLLVEASRRAAELPPATRERMKPFVVAARSRLRVARELRDPETQGTAFGLLREAAFLALRALEESAEAAPALSSPVLAWERFCALPTQPNAPASLPEVRHLLATDDVLVTEARLPPDATALRAATEEVVSWLLSLAEVRSPEELVRARALRSATLVVSLLVIVAALLGYWFALMRLAPPRY